jgi:hypothetical protein
MQQNVEKEEVWVLSEYTVCRKKWNCVFTLDKSRDSELENGISYTTVEGKWESNSALKVNKLVTPLLRKWPLNVFWYTICLPTCLVVQNSITDIF